jgi:hypothetical protein
VLVGAPVVVDTVSRSAMTFLHSVLILALGP